MKVTFAYDFDKDVDNFIRGTRAKNSSQPTPLQEAFIAAHGIDYTEQKVRDFLKVRDAAASHHPQDFLEEIENNWRAIEDQFSKKAEKMFGVSLPKQKIVVYLTTNQRCTYNIPEGYFFVNFASKSPNRTIMHELLHFYTWYAFHDELIVRGIDEDQYNDIKESLTVLLNTEFADFMGQAIDVGYPQHAEMRKRVQRLWDESKDIRKVIFEVFSLPN